MNQRYLAIAAVALALALGAGHVSAAGDEWTSKAVKGLLPGGKESQEKTTLTGKIVPRDEKDKDGKPITSAFLEQDDGSLIPLPCAPKKDGDKRIAGKAAAILRGTMQGLKQGHSHLVAVHPDTLEVLHHIPLPEPATVPHIITMFEGRIAIYLGLDSGARRAFWDPATRKLSLDDSWVVSPMQKGQTTADAPSLLGDWIVLQTNGIGSSTVASSIVAVHQKDPKRMKVVFPFGPLKPGEWSFAPPKPQTDPENSMIYSADMGVEKVAGIKIDQQTGELKVVWVIDDTTNAFQPLIGPKDQRVILLSNMKRNVEGQPIQQTIFTANYTEQVTWRDAATGRLIAGSDFFEPLTPGSLVTPGFGGRVYFPTANGFITLEARPAARS